MAGRAGRCAYSVPIDVNLGPLAARARKDVSSLFKARVQRTPPEPTMRFLSVFDDVFT